MPPKTVPEQMIESFRQFAAEIFSKYGEPKSLSLVIDWNVGQNDFPAGLMIPRNGTIDPDELLEFFAQLQKFGRRVLELYGNELSKVMQDFKRLQEEVAALEKRKRELTAGESTQGTT